MHVVGFRNLVFKRQLRPKEEAEYSAILKQAKDRVGNSGHSMLIIPSASLPASANSGIGNLLDKEAKDFVDFAKKYWGINYIQLLPEGSFYFDNKKGVLPYSGSSLDLGKQLINIEKLSSNEYGNLLSAKDLKLYSEKNQKIINSTEINYEKFLLKNTHNESILKKAYTELLKSDTLKKQELLKEISLFSEKNQEWLEPKSIFEALSLKYQTDKIHLWNNFEQNLYNTDVVTLNERINYINQLKNSPLGEEIKFYEFKQFLAEKHLAEAKKELNQKGIKLSGDVIIGFSKDEKWANPKAFIKDSSVGWGLPALNYDKAEGEQLLRLKIRNFANRYDGLRIDASWVYVDQPVQNYLTKENSVKRYNEKILNIIDDEIIKTKGKSFNLNNVTHEFLTNERNFSIYEGRKIRPFLENRLKLFTTEYLSSNWANVSAFEKQGWNKNDFILGISNHDSKSLRNIYANPSQKKEQIKTLSEVLKIPEKKINTLQSFIQTKFAEPIRSKNNMFFFTEALNIEGQYKGNANSLSDYRIKVPKNYKENYFLSLERGEGFNIMDALEKAFVAEGLDKKENKLFKKIVKYNKILQSKEEKTINKSLKITACGIVVISSIIALIFTQHKKRTEKIGSNAQ